MLTMTDKSHTVGNPEDQLLPDCRELALFVAGLFQNLGGQLFIGDGRRSALRPEPAYFRLRSEDLPQLPNAEPWEQFHSAEEWRGALKVAEYWLTRLSAADKDFVFTLMAPAFVDGNFDFREHIQ
jgi:hypothetical protein